MTFPVINSPIADQIIKTLCNTLVHSLWQGLLLAAVAGLIVIFTKRSSSAMRYNLLIAALILFAVGTVITFIVEFKPGYNVNQIAGQPVSFTQQNTFAVAQPNPGAVVQNESVASILSGYLNTYHNSIVLIWFLIICAKSMQLGVGLYGTYQLKRLNVVATGSYWTERVQQLACLLGVSRAVSLMESGIAKVPMVIGHLKPVILIPIGLLTALSADEVEAILVHELAHIKRRDYLINMLQSLMEIIFFFNPAVLWISQLIKTERENCCDDMVVEQSSNRISYIRALVSCEEYQAAVPAYAMAFPGSKNSLLDRVKRLATNRNHSLNLFEKTFLAVCLVVSGLCMSAFAERDNIKRTVNNVVKLFAHDTLNNEQKQKLVEQTNLLKQQTAMIRVNTALLQARSAGLEMVNDTNKKLHVPVNVHIDPLNIQVPNVDFHLDPLTVQMPKLNVNVNPLNVQVKDVNVHTEQLKVDVQVQNINVQTIPLKLTVITPDVKLHLDPLNLSLGKIDTNKKVKVKVNEKVKNAAVMKTFHEIGRELFKMHVVTDTNNLSINLNERLLIVNGEKQSDEIHRLIFEKFGANGNINGFEGANSSGNYNSYPNSYSSSNSASSSGAFSSSFSSSGAGSGSFPKLSDKILSPSRDKVNKKNEQLITDDLLKDKLIPNTDKFNFTLSSKEFILNGKKQSDAVFEKYKKKYVPSDGGDRWTWSHSHSN